MDEASRVHRGAGQRDGVADGGARAAAGTHAPHRAAHWPRRERSGRTDPACSFCAESAAIGLVRGSQCADRLSLGRGRSRPHSEIRGGIDRAWAVLFGSGGAVEELLRATRTTVPIVFAIVPDPVGSGFVDSLSRPGRNATGFMQFEYGLSAKWLDLLKQIAPGVMRAAVLRDPATTAGIGQFAVIQYVASSVGVEVVPISLSDATEIERGVEAFARSTNDGGLIVTAGGLAAFHRELITTLAARYKLPGVYNNRTFVTAGGLISYGADLVDQYRRAAGYVDRILRGEKPADLPVQAPTKYELAINLKTAKALGLEVPHSLLAR